MKRRTTRRNIFAVRHIGHRNDTGKAILSRRRDLIETHRCLGFTLEVDGAVAVGHVEDIVHHSKTKWLVEQGSLHGFEILAYREVTTGSKPCRNRRTQATPLCEGVLRVSNPSRLEKALREGFPVGDGWGHLRLEGLR